MNGRRQGSIAGAIAWMSFLSLLLFWMPLLGPIIAGYVGGKKAGGFLAALSAVFLPGIVFGILLYMIASSLSGIPLLGAIAGAGGVLLSLAHIGPLLLGAMIGGLLAPKAINTTPTTSVAETLPGVTPPVTSSQPLSSLEKKGWKDRLNEAELSQYIDVFEENDIDESLFPRLTESDLRDLGISSIGVRKRMLRIIAESRALQEIQADIPVVDLSQTIREIKGNPSVGRIKDLIEEQGIRKTATQLKIPATKKQLIGRLFVRCVLPFSILGILVVMAASSKLSHHGSMFMRILDPLLLVLFWSLIGFLIGLPIYFIKRKKNLMQLAVKYGIPEGPGGGAGMDTSEMGASARET